MPPVRAKRPRRRVAGAVLAAGIGTAWGGGVPIPAGGGQIFAPVVSFQEARFSTVVQQEYDYSCGSASLATLLTHHYADPVTEREVFERMYEAGDREKIQAEGFSLLDMKRYLEHRGYLADGFRISLDRLIAAGVPSIVLLDDAGYLHFVVVKGVSARDVLLGDPAKGRRLMSRDAFEASWNGIFFIIRDRADVAQRHFNSEDWQVVAQAPVELALTHARTALSAIHLRQPGDF
jgi:uncharacterized protein